MRRWIASLFRRLAEALVRLYPLRELGSEVRYFRADVSSREERETLVASVRSAFGRLHLLVNNAGVAPSQRADILDAGEESFDRLVGTNLKGPYFLTQAVARFMLERIEIGAVHGLPA